MKTFRKLTEAWLDNKNLYWNDPELIQGNDYKITFIEELLEEAENLENDELMPILIQYNNGQSEAQVFLHEIIVK